MLGQHPWSLVFISIVDWEQDLLTGRLNSVFLTEKKHNDSFENMTQFFEDFENVF